ncbi:MAG: LytR/AlgR family response regulator transcription factor [Nitritalea sp.]
MPHIPKILLIEDNFSLAENTKELLELSGYSVTEILPSSEGLEESLRFNKPDLVLLDIRLQGKHDGITIGKMIRGLAAIPIVFLTSSSEKKVLHEVKEIVPEGYIVKPYSKETLITTVTIALNSFHHHSKGKGITLEPDIIGSANEFFIREKGWLKRVNIDHIQYLKTEGSYVHIHLKDKTITIRNTVKDLMSRLPESYFIRVHKSFIANIKMINAFNSKEIRFENDTIPLGRMYYSDLMDSVNKINL